MAASPTTEGKRASFDSFQSAHSASQSQSHDENGHGAAGSGPGPSPEQQAQESEPTTIAAAEATVTCPHCDQPLPASLLATHKLGESSRRPRRPTLSASASSPAVPGSGAATPHGESAPDRPASRRSSLPGEPSGTSESLKTSVDQADASETAASKSAISDDELRRWSSLAGVSLELPSKADKPAPTPASLAAASSSVNAFPLLPPPPPGAAKAPASKPSPRAAASTSRFGFFARNKSKADIDSDDDSDSGGAGGYARLAGPGSDDDDDDDGYESDKPFPKKSPVKAEPRAEEEAAEAEAAAAKPPLPAAAAPEPAAAASPAGAVSTDDSDLRTLLREVLGRVHTLSKSHAELVESHTSLLTLLKIARSNLVMAEANTEMLEEELKRAKAAQPRSSAAGSDRPSGDGGRGRPPSLQILPSPGISSKTESKGFGFWNSGNKKKVVASSAVQSPTSGEPAQTLTVRTSTDSSAPRSPMSEAAVAAEAPHAAELKRLRDEAAANQAKLDKQADELEALKYGKKELEAELEGLSQALFEEANKMVSDERKRVTELEENLREVKDEREALRETVKVLGGRLVTPAPGTPVIGANGEDGAELSPNLDKHYAALRRSIHHVVNEPTPGTSPDDSEAEAAVEAVVNGADAADNAADDTPKKTAEEIMRMDTPKQSLETGPNPWA
ncbi:uncharacterized protein LOC62_06G008321 [Vanrija pseudolonga]|uniref:GDP/GTP exchange factor Sec2 N-terminal domain-containing protein n=1 Tax=Vanrija pseudolonga TaxID=143232 RepID=A0AAF1BNW3_9TREE|nr:hypothetical protein LOC62_06G008321 [Vanrija pseudolonga]